MPRLGHTANFRILTTVPHHSSTFRIPHLGILPAFCQPYSDRPSVAGEVFAHICHRPDISFPTIVTAAVHKSVKNVMQHKIRTKEIYLHKNQH